jgi:peroxiredoxin
MKCFIITLLSVFSVSLLQAQQQKTDFSEISLRDANESKVLVSDLLKLNKANLLVFFRLDDGKSCALVNELYEAAMESLHGMDFQLITVVETSTSMAQLEQSYLRANAPEVKCFTDENGVLKRHLAITELPYSILFNSDGVKVCSQRGYCVDASEQLCRKVRTYLSEMDQLNLVK